MKPTRSVFSKTLFGLLTILNACFLVWGESGCPPAEDITPCVCYNSPFTVLVCNGILRDEVLRGIFERSKDYKYTEVHLKYSTLKYFPKAMFEKTIVAELYIENSTLNALFDSPPEGLHNLRKIHLENTKITEISHWELLKPLTHLEVLTIYFNQIPTIDSVFGEYVTKNLAHIIFYATGTKYIAPGALSEFTKLDRVSFDACKIKEISRDIFSSPFNGRSIYFNNNEISVIPDDMFNDMPNLQTVGLRENLLTTIPESAFMGHNTGRLTYLLLDGNPIKCSCSLLWLINNKPEVIKGTCATPIRLHDRNISELTPKDLKC